MRADWGNARELAEIERGTLKKQLLTWELAEGGAARG
jgi:hypothetical protein